MRCDRVTAVPFSARRSWPAAAAAKNHSSGRMQQMRPTLGRWHRCGSGAIGRKAKRVSSVLAWLLGVLTDEAGAPRRLALMSGQPVAYLALLLLGLSLKGEGAVKPVHPNKDVIGCSLLLPAISLLAIGARFDPHLSVLLVVLTWRRWRIRLWAKVLWAILILLSGLARTISLYFWCFLHALGRRSNSLLDALPFALVALDPGRRFRF